MTEHKMPDDENPLARRDSLASSAHGDLPRPTPDVLPALTPERCAEIVSHVRSIKRHVPPEFTADWKMLDHAADLLARLRVDLATCHQEKEELFGIIAGLRDVIAGRMVPLEQVRTFAISQHQHMAEMRIEELETALAACEAERNLRLDTDTSLKDRAGMARLPGLAAENARLTEALMRTVNVLRERGKHPASCPKGRGIGYYEPVAGAICSCGIDQCLAP